MKVATVLAILALGLTSQQSSRAAQVADKPSHWYGPVTQSCGAWLASSAREKEILQWWMLGFVSGAGFRRETELMGTDSKGIEAWVDKYCGDHPLIPITKAAVDLVVELGLKR